VAVVASSNNAYNTAYLPVNGSSGVILDGSKDFTLSVAVTPGSAGATGVSLSSVASPGAIFNNSLATLVTGSGVTAYAFNGGGITYVGGFAGTNTVSLAYSASAGTLTYTVGGTVMLTQSGVTSAKSQPCAPL